MGMLSIRFSAWTDRGLKLGDQWEKHLPSNFIQFFVCFEETCRFKTSVGWSQLWHTMRFCSHVHLSQHWLWWGGYLYIYLYLCTLHLVYLNGFVFSTSNKQGLVWGGWQEMKCNVLNQQIGALVPRWGKLCCRRWNHRQNTPLLPHKQL